MGSRVPLGRLSIINAPSAIIDLKSMLHRVLCFRSFRRAIPMETKANTTAITTSTTRNCQEASMMFEMTHASAISSSKRTAYSKMTKVVPPK
jgi:hypothetical protein